MTFTCPTCTQAQPAAEPTLTQALAARGLTHRPRSGPGLQGREVVDAEGAVVFAGPWHECWAWLRGEVAA